MSTSLARRAHLLLAWLFVGSVVVQAYLAALDDLGGAGHLLANGDPGRSVVGILALLVLLSALAARLSRRDVTAAFGLLVLTFVQALLAGAARAGPSAVAALYPVNVLALFWLGVEVARRFRDACR